MNANLTLHPGVVLDLAENDYAYGIGRLAMTVQLIGADEVEHRGTKWVYLVGKELRWDGAPGPRRQATVKVDAIPRALRPAEWRPARHEP